MAHVSNALGTINPVKRIIELAHAAACRCCVDGAQAVPHLPVDVRELDCDFYVFSGHKLYGPTGIGVLYGKDAHAGSDAAVPGRRRHDPLGELREDDVQRVCRTSSRRARRTSPAPSAWGRRSNTWKTIGRDAIAAHEARLLAVRHRAAVGDSRRAASIGTAQRQGGRDLVRGGRAAVSALDVGTQLDLEGVAVRTGHHCCQPLMDRFGMPGTARASFAMYNTLEEVDVFADALEKIAAKAKPRVVPAGKIEANYPSAAADSPMEAADELAEVFEVIEDWTEKYEYLIEIGAKLPPMPAALKQECNRVQGCQSTVFMHLRKKPGEMPMWSNSSPTATPTLCARRVGVVAAAL